MYFHVPFFSPTVSGKWTSTPQGSSPWCYLSFFVERKSWSMSVWVAEVPFRVVFLSYDWVSTIDLTLFSVPQYDISFIVSIPAQRDPYRQPNSLLFFLVLPSWVCNRILLRTQRTIYFSPSVSVKNMILFSWDFLFLSFSSSYIRGWTNQYSLLVTVQRHCVNTRISSHSIYLSLRPSPRVCHCFAKSKVNLLSYVLTPQFSLECQVTRWWD